MKEEEEEEEKRARRSEVKSVKRHERPRHSAVEIKARREGVRVCVMM